MKQAITYFDNFRGPNEYGFLSNFHTSWFTLGGVMFRSGEHAFQAYKATSYKDFTRVRESAYPGTAKQLGRKIKLRPDWEFVKYDVMRQVLRAKFPAGSDLGNKLLATGDAMLIEGNTWNDRVWGVNEGTMKGRNWLGHLLMARRAELRSGYGEADATVAMFFIKVGVR